MFACFVGEPFGQSEVDDEELLLGRLPENVLRFDVSVEYAFAVESRQDVDGFNRDLANGLVYMNLPSKRT